MISKGLTKSENPDVLVSIFTDTKERVMFITTWLGGIRYGWG
jgi:hypothetical protein